MIKDLTFITGNKHKAKQLSEYLGADVSHHNLDLEEIQSMSLEEIVEYKLKRAYEAIKKPVIVDDVSLELGCLNGFPGPLTKWFQSSLSGQEICDLVKKYDDKTATVRVVIGFYDGKTLEYFETAVPGTIAETPAGEGGFGFDIFFIPNGYEITRGLMNEEDYEKTNHRKMSVEKLKKYLETYE